MISFRACFAAGWICLAVGWLPAQQLTGVISGTISDTAGSAIAGAALRLNSESTGATRDTVSDSAGNYQFNAIAAGNYRLTVRHPGFKAYERKAIELTANQSLSMGIIRMDVGDVSESITVSAEVNTVQITSGERSGIITAEEIQNLTVMNRDFATLVALLPGVVDNPGSAEVQGFSGGASFNVAGNRSNANSITIDGGSTENTNGGNGNNFVSMDSIATVRIVTSAFQPEFGRKPAASIMAITKGGGKQFHGAAYWYYRHEWMNANQFFNNRSGVPQTPRRVQTPGFNIGGPVFWPGKFNRGKSKLFFFTSLELIRERRPQDIRELTTPTELERQGDFSKSINTNGRLFTVNDPLNNKAPFADNVIPAARIDASGRNYLKLLPPPSNVNPLIALNTYNFQAQESLNIPKISNSTRIDYMINAKTTVWFKYNYWREDQKGWAVSAGNSNWGWMPAHYLNKTHAPVLSMTHLISPTMILEASARITRWTEDGSALSEERLQALNRKTAGVNIPQLYPGGNPLNLVPNATFGGISRAIGTSLNARFPLRGAETPGFSDVTVSKIKDTHTWKFGLYFERWRAVKGESGNWNGTLDFSADTNNPGDSGNAFANALLGNFRSYTESNNRPPLYEGTISYEWYVQDNWRVTRRFALEYGIRFGWSQPFYSLRRQEAGFVPAMWNAKNAIQFMSPVRVNNVRLARHPVTGATFPATIIGAVAPNTGDPFNGTVNLLTNADYPHGLRENSGVKAAPRFGFAYDPVGKGKTVIRGGMGLFYEIHEKDLWGYALHLDPPNQLTPQIFYGDLNTFSNTQGFLFPSNTSGLNSDRTMGRTMSYSFNIQQQVGRGNLVDVAYVGTLGRHLLERKDLNSIAVGTTYQAAALDPTNNNAALPTQLLRPFPGYGNIQFYNYDSNSSYHSLQAQVKRQVSKGLSGGLAWTWSKTMDYGDSDTVNLSNLVSPKVWNYGKAGFDRTHILKGYWYWAVPGASRHLPFSGGASKALARGLFDGWQMSGILTMMSGAPLGVSLGLTSGSANNWSGSPTDAARPNVIANPILPKDQRTFAVNLNRDAFGLPNQATLGNAPKDVYRGPGRNNWDISLFKNFRVSERWRNLNAQFRAESYNTFNHTQFTGVDSTARIDVRTGALAAPTFGQFTSAGLARRMQLAMRLTF
ncbi:MAG: carboxypeptidase regulatory-like domain-containing protein [Candidatus Solibacter usitatus]|nr:carboxypeptidase regulatory-like domain-containing protein [Candidatus Solibacter usitatus]